MSLSMNANYRRASHTLYTVTLHIVWITKYRYKVLKWTIGEEAKKQIRMICNELDVEIISGSISPDHVHILVSIPPSLSVSKLLQQIKGKTSRKLQIQFPELKKKYWWQHLWARWYFVCSTWNVTSEMIQQYIEHHFEENESEDSFRLEES